METLDGMSTADLDALIARAEQTKRAKVAASAPKGTPVVVTTVHRGVFYGYAEDTTGETITLTKARNCLYWSADVQGFLGLSVTGPTAGCRIGAEAATLTLRNITSVTACSAKASLAWESAAWKK